MWWIRSHWPKLVDGTFYQVDFLFLSAMNRPSSCQIFSVDVHKCQKSTNTNSTRFPYRSVATLLQFAFTLPCFKTSWSFQTYLDIWTNIQNCNTHPCCCMQGNILLPCPTHATPIPSTSAEKQTIQFNHKCTDTNAANISSIPKHIQPLHWLSHMYKLSTHLLWETRRWGWNDHHDGRGRVKNCGLSPKSMRSPGDLIKP